MAEQLSANTYGKGSWLARVAHRKAQLSTDNLSNLSACSDGPVSQREENDKMTSYKPQYHDDSEDADDEFERANYTSPTLPRDLSPTESDMTSPEHTPTTYAHSHSEGSHASPTGLITQWTAEQCADYMTSLGLGQYAHAAIENNVYGLVLVEMQHDDLKEMGMASVGHRVTLLKGVYDIKVKQNVPLGEDDYVPLSAGEAAQDLAATQDDITRVIESIRLRDQRIIQAEAELRTLRADLDRISEENRKLREETLPIIRMAKDRSQPLPDPERPLTTPPADIKPEKLGSSLSRKFSTKKLFLGGAPKNPSPTIHESRPLQDSTSLDPSAAAMAASSHLTASMTSQQSPNQISQLSPTSPAYSTAQASSAGSRSFPRDGPQSSRSNYQSSHDDAPYNNGSHWSGSTMVSSAPGRRAAATPAPAPAPDDPPNSAPLPSSHPTSNPLSRADGSGSASVAPSSTGRDRDNPQVEIFKSFRVSIEDPCHKVLPVALKRYQIMDDWRQYALYIVYGDQERCLGLEEKPLMLFKQLDKEGRKPMFMLRKHASPAGQGWEGSASRGTAGQAGAVGAEAGRLPGGVL